MLPWWHRVHTKMAIHLAVNVGLERWECLRFPSARHEHALAIVEPFRLLHRDFLSHQVDVSASLQAHDANADSRVTKIVGIVAIATFPVVVLGLSAAQSLQVALRRALRMEPDGPMTQPANYALQDDFRSRWADVRDWTSEEWVIACAVQPFTCWLNSRCKPPCQMITATVVRYVFSHRSPAFLNRARRTTAQIKASSMSFQCAHFKPRQRAGLPRTRVNLKYGQLWRAPRITARLLFGTKHYENIVVYSNWSTLIVSTILIDDDVILRERKSRKRMGRRHDLTSNEKHTIDTLSDLGYSSRAIREAVSRSRSAISAYLAKKSKGMRTKLAGRKSILSERDKRSIINDARQGRKTARDVYGPWSDAVSLWTIQSVLSEADNLSFGHLQVHPMLSTPQRKKRYVFAHEQRFMDVAELRRTVFTDEKRFCLDGPDGACHFWADTRLPRDIFSKRQRCGGGVMVWGGIS